MEMPQQILAIALVLAALFGLVWVAKRKGWASVRTPVGRDAKAKLEVIDRLVLTPQHSVHLIRLENRTLLVGLSPGGCNLLETMPGSNASSSAA